MKIAKYTFCHIPKTGGMTIRSLLLRSCLVNQHIGHQICKKNKNSFLFAFVRNPYTRCLSAFNYLKKGGMPGCPWDKRDCEIYFKNINFEEFITTSLKNVSKDQTHFKPQHFWLPNGANFIGYYENFVEDIEKLNKIILLKDFQHLPHKNKTKYKYCNIIPNNLKEIIYDVYKKDFEIFNYEQ